MTSWETVLVDWCNCLELSKKVEDLNGLRDGVFFKEIFGVLNKSDVLKNGKGTMEDFICLLNDTYVNCGFEGAEICSFCDFTNEELIIFTSLLMHYTCIYDRRDVLTSPLCHSLPRATQLSIKCFLEMRSSDITPCTILKMMKNSSVESERDTETSKDCKLVSSPLTGIFETPISKNSKLHEKDKEIAKLKSSLEMAMYEKADLQEELKLEVEKRKRLENLLSKSNVDVARLRREITSLECRTPPHFRAIDSSDIEKRLKKEIQSLEHYIEKSEKENDAIRDECFSNRKKLSELQTQYAELQTKYLDAEKQTEEFTKVCTNQGAKISTLESYCDELHSLLEEYQTTPANDSSFFETSVANVRRSLPRVEENLACSVVEVQLKEAKEEIEKLHQNIENINIERVTYEKNMNTKIEELNLVVNTYKDSNEKTTLEIQLMKQIIEEKDNELRKNSSKIEILKADYEQSMAQNEVFRSQLSQSQEAHSQTLEKLRVLEENSKLKISELNENIEELNSRCDQLLLEQQSLESKLNISEDANKKCLDDIQSLQEIINLKDKELNDAESGKIENLNKIKILKADYEQSMAQNEVLRSQLSQYQEAHSQTLEKLRVVEEDSKLKIRELNENIEELNSRCDQLLLEQQSLESKLNISEDTNKKCLDDIQSLKDIVNLKEKELNDAESEKIENLNKIIVLKADYEQSMAQNEVLRSQLSQSQEAHSQTLEKLRVLKEDSKLKISELNENIEELNSRCDQLLLEQQSLESKLNIFEDTNKKCLDDIQSLKEIINLKEKELNDAESENIENLNKIKILKADYEQSMAQNELLQSQLSRSQEAHSQTSEKLRVVEEDSKLKISELNENIEELNSRCDQLLLEQQSLESKLNISEDTNKKCLDDIQSLKVIIHLKDKDAESEKIENLNKIKILKADYEQSMAQNEVLQSQLSQSQEAHLLTLENLKVAKEDSKLKQCELNGTINKLNESIEVMSSRCDQLVLEKQELGKKLTISEETNTKSLDNIQFLLETTKHNEKELNNAKNEIIKYVTEIETLTRDHQQLQEVNQELLSKLKLSEEINMNIILSLETDIKQRENEFDRVIGEKTKLIENLTSNNNELNNLNQELMSELKISKENNEKYSTTSENLERSNNEKENQLSCVTEEKNQMKSQIDLLLIQNQELVNKLLMLEETNTTCSSRIQNLEENIKKTEQELNHIKNERDKYICDIETMKIDHEQSITENQKLINNLGLLNNKNKEIADKISFLEVKNVEEKNKLISDIETLTVQNQKLTSKLKHNEEKLASITDFVAYLKEKLSETNVLVRKDLNEYFNLITKLREAFEIHTLKLKTAEQQIEGLKKDIEKEQNIKETLSNKLEILDKDSVELNKTKDKLLIENQTIKQDYITLIKTIGMYNEELNKVVKNLKKGKVVGSELSDAQIAYSKFNVLSDIMSPIKTKNDEKSDEIFELGQQISKINAYIDLYTEKETFYQNEIDNLKGELAALNSNYFNLTENLKEQNCDNEYQITSLTENLHSVVGKYNQLQSDYREYLNKISGYETEIAKLKKIYSDLKVTNDLDKMKLQEEILKLEEDVLKLKRNRESLIEEHQNEIKTLLDKQLDHCNEYENKIVVLNAQIEKYQKDKFDSEKKLESMSAEYASRIEKLQIEILRKEDEINSLKNKCEESEFKMISINKERMKNSKSEEEFETILAKLQVQVVGSKLEITKLEKERQKLLFDNENLSRQMEHAKDELEQERIINEKLHKELLSKEIQLKDLELTNEKLKTTLQETSNSKFLEEKQVELQQKIDTLMKSNDLQKQTYEFFKLYYKKFKEKLDKLLSQRNILENLTSNLRILIANINKISVHETPNFRKLIEKKEAMEIISEDIMKQYNRYSKRINDIIFEVVQYYERNCDNLLSSLVIEQDNYLDNYNMEELYDQLSDLSERTSDALEQIKTLHKDLDNLNKTEEEMKPQKENILGTCNKINVEKMKEDELKKKNLALKQKVTLLDNAKSNLEKTVKKLREENKKLKETDKPEMPDNDVHYKMLLQEYISYKEEHEKIIEDYKSKLENLQKNYDDQKGDRLRTSTPFGDEHYSESRLQADLLNLQEAYANIRSINAKLEAENVHSRKIIEHHEQEVMKFNLIKEAYDKLLEENNKLMTDVDTIKYKRSRDRDEFIRLLKEKSDNQNKNLKQIQGVKAEYEAKLERMKDKMIKLYRDEINKEMNKVKAGQHENSSLLKMIEKMRGDLFEAEQKIQLLEMEREMQKSKEQYSSKESLYVNESEARSLTDFSSVSSSANLTGAKPRTSVAAPMEFKHPRKVNPSSLETRKQYQERRASTLPRTGTVLEEVTISRRTSIGVPANMGTNLEMEDEEEMFNNKYLADLKQGKCDLSTVGDRDSRVSELAWRNSLVPPHLKSSYPAEMQFCSPGRFKDDDLKASNVPFDDSLSKLLPGDKPRKKDFGTTSYKKPGPPTPSKNGGRLSLQGNEVHPARDQQYEVKRSTPSRIRALFTGRNSSKSSTEVTTPPRRRLNIFRR